MTRWSRRASGILLLALVASGCRKDEVSVYRIPREEAPLRETRAVEPPSLHLHWDKLPEGWREQPQARMRAATFQVTGAEGKQAEIAAIGFPGMGGSDVQFVNLWREQLGLTAVTEADLPKISEAITISGDPGKLFDITSGESNNPATRGERIVVAVQQRDGVTWFVKMTGDAALVAAQKPPFLEFLKTVTFHSKAHAGESAPAAPASPSGPAGSAAKPTWTIPPGWKEQPASAMRVGSFLVTAPDGKADISVFSFGGPAGGIVANINRWRQQQLGLAGIAEADLEKSTTPLELADGKALHVEMTGVDPQTSKPASIGAVILPRGGQTWFYKMMGDVPVVAREKESFLAFVKSARHP